MNLDKSQSVLETKKEPTYLSVKSHALKKSQGNEKRTIIKSHLLFYEYPVISTLLKDKNKGIERDVDPLE